jgi:hypothetical protein
MKPKTPLDALTKSAKVLYNHNPFYLISACLVLYGFSEIFADHQGLAGDWLLIGLLCGYTLLLAITGYLVVRFGRIWEDARTILLVILFLLLALSISFDKTSLNRPAWGAELLGLGFLFAVGLTEVLCRSLKIRLDRMYRVPYYLLLGQLFVIPPVLGVLSVTDHEDIMVLCVLAFPAGAGLLFLTLLPAMHLGGRHEPPNGTPWPWPWYPWPIFVILGVAMALRSYALSMVYEPTNGADVGWQPYFLAPLVLCWAILFVEGGVKHGNRRLARIAALAPLGLVLIAFPGSPDNPPQQRFLEMLGDSVGSPTFVTFVLLAAFSAYALIRGVRQAEFGLTACVLAFVFVDQQTVGWQTLAEPRTLPVWLVAALQIGISIAKGRSRRWVLGWLLAVAATAFETRHIESDGLWVYLPMHLAVVALLATPLVCRDLFGWRVVRVAPYVLPALSLIAALAYERAFPNVPSWVHLIYMTVLVGESVAIWVITARVEQLAASLVCGGAYCVQAAKDLYRVLLKTMLSSGLHWLAWGLALLLIAALVSCIKAGGLRRVWTTLRMLNRSMLKGTLIRERLD